MRGPPVIGKRKRGGVYVFPFFWLTLLFVALPCILPHQLDPLAEANRVVSAVFSLGVLAIVYFLAMWFVYAFFSEPDQYTIFGAFLGTLDCILALLLAIPLLAFTLIVLGGQEHISGVPVGVKGYYLYYTYCLSNTVTVFFTAGTTNAAGRTALGATWNMLASMTGAVMLVFGIGLLFILFSTTYSEDKRFYISKNYPNPKGSDWGELRKRRPPSEMRTLKEHRNRK